MKRLLFTMMLIVAALAIWAQRWTPVNANSYSSEAIVYVQVTISGRVATANNPLEVSAFMDDKCRAQSTSIYTPATNTGPRNCYCLRIPGNPQEDANKAITFKVFYNGLVYIFSETKKWTDTETIQPVPVVLNLEPLTNVQIDPSAGSPITIEMDETKNMASLMTLLYGNGKTESEVTDSSIDSEETEIFFSWNAGNYVIFFDIDNDGVITPKQVTPQTVNVSMTVMVRDKSDIQNPSESPYTSINPLGIPIEIVDPVVPVTKIECDLTELPLFVGDDVKSALSQHVTISPDEATNKTWNIVDPSDLVDNSGIAIEAGTTTLSLVPNVPADNQVQPALVQLTVKIRPIGISASVNVVEVELGENAVEAIKNVLVFSPEDENVDKEVYISPENERLYDPESGIATMVGNTNVVITLVNANLANLPAAPSVSVRLVVKKSVKSIALEPGEVTAYFNENVKEAIADRVTILPDDATNKDYVLVEEAETLRIYNDIASMVGTTKVRVKSADNEQLISDDFVTVNILYRPTGIIANSTEITVNVGDNVKEAIENEVFLEPETYYLDRSLTLTPGNNILYDKNFIANKKGQMTVVVTPTAAQPNQDGTIPSVTFTVNVVQPVTGIQLAGDPIIVYLNNDVAQALKDQVTIEPSTASDKSFQVVETKEQEPFLISSDGFAAEPGKTTVKVSANNFLSTNTSEVTIMVHPSYIDGPRELTVNVGDNVLDAIMAVVKVGNPNYDENYSEFIDKAIELSSNSETSLYDANYKATKVGTMNVIITAVSTKGSAAAGPLTKTIVLTVKQGVTSITAQETTITCLLNDNVGEMIRERITVYPSDATNQVINLEIENGDKWLMNDIAVLLGTWTVVAKSDDNPQAAITFTVVVKEPVTLTFNPDVETTVGGETTLRLRKIAGTDDPDVSKVELHFAETSLGPVASATPDATGLIWTIKGIQAGSYHFTVTYDGRVQYSEQQTEFGTINIGQVVSPASGWDWITVNSLPSNRSSIVLLLDKTANTWTTEMENGRNKVIEIRSQSAVLYNDPNYGLFGDITELKPGDGMYKIKTEGNVVFEIGADVSSISASDLPKTVRGYTWLGYPHVVDQPLTALQDALARTAEEGDMIIGKDNFASFTGGEWVAPEGFTFKAGKGYMYYTTGQAGKTIDWGTPVVIQLPNQDSPAKSLRGDIWNYDVHAFAYNMPVIAVLEGIDNLEDYSVGAFVEDECRGEGKVAAGKYMFINVAGNGGETVTFKLYNKLTGQYTSLGEKVAYGEMAGSLRQPMMLKTEPTAIHNIYSEDGSAAISYSNGTVRVNGLPNAFITISNAAGSVVRTSKVPMVSLAGLADGVYVVTIVSGSQRFSKKIVK